MNRLVLAAFLLFAQLGVAQTYRIQNAKNFLESGQIDSANYHIQFALKHARTSKYSKTWHCYFKINQAFLQQPATSPADSTRYLKRLFEAYQNCKAYDQTNEFLPSITPLMVSVCEKFNREAQKYYAIHRLNSYVMVQDLYVTCLRALGKVAAEETFQLAEAHHDLKNFEDALIHYKYCIENQHMVEHAYIESIEVLYDMNKPEEADQLYLEAISKFPLSTKLIFIEIGQLISKKLYFKARTRILEALEKNGTNADLYLLLGQVNGQLGLEEDAFIAYQQAGEAAPSNFNICLKVGLFFLDKANESHDTELYKSARIFLEKSESIHPEDTTVLLGLKDLYLKSGDLPNYERVNQKLN